MTTGAATPLPEELVVVGVQDEIIAAEAVASRGTRNFMMLNGLVL